MEIFQYLLLLVVAVKSYGNFQWDWALVVGRMARGVGTSVMVCILDWVQFGALKNLQLVWEGGAMMQGDTRWGAI